MRISTSRLLLALPLILLLTGARVDAAPRAFGVGQLELGGGGALSFPLAQEDAALGSGYHLRARFGLRPRWALEASNTLEFLGDGETPSGGSIEAPGFWTTHFSGVFHMGGLGLAGLLRGGVGWTRVMLPEDVENDIHFSWEVGAAVEYRFGALRTELGPHLVVVDLGDATRKFAELRLSAVFPLF